MYTGNNFVKGKVILMLQVRQQSLVNSHPYLPYCRHAHYAYIALNIFKSYFWALFLSSFFLLIKVLPLQLFSFG